MCVNFAKDNSVKQFQVSTNHFLRKILKRATDPIFARSFVNCVTGRCGISRQPLSPSVKLLSKPNRMSMVLLGVVEEPGTFVLYCYPGTIFKDYFLSSLSELNPHTLVGIHCTCCTCLNTTLNCRKCGSALVSVKLMFRL